MKKMLLLLLSYSVYLFGLQRNEFAGIFNQEGQIVYSKKTIVVQGVGERTLDRAYPAFLRSGNRIFYCMIFSASKLPDSLRVGDAHFSLYPTKKRLPGAFGVFVGMILDKDQQVVFFDGSSMNPNLYVGTVNVARDIRIKTIFDWLSRCLKRRNRMHLD